MNLIAIKFITLKMIYHLSFRSTDCDEREIVFDTPATIRRIYDSKYRQNYCSNKGQ